MGYNFGGAVIDFDFRNVLGELSEDRARLRYGGESAEELEQKDRIDAGQLALDAFPWAVNPADAPIRYEAASSRDFDDYAYAGVNGKTVLLGRNLGLGQGDLVEQGNALSARRGEVLLFWINDASGSYAFSVFKGGQRVRYWSSGEGLSDDEGPPLPAEGGIDHGCDRVFAVFLAALGMTVIQLFEVPFERFDRAG